MDVEAERADDNSDAPNAGDAEKVDFGFLPSDACLDRRLEVLVSYLVEGRSLERQGAGRKERIRRAKVRSRGDPWMVGTDRDRYRNDRSIQG